MLLLFKVDIRILFTPIILLWINQISVFKDYDEREINQETTENIKDMLTPFTVVAAIKA